MGNEVIVLKITVCSFYSKSERSGVLYELESFRVDANN